MVGFLAVVAACRPQSPAPPSATPAEKAPSLETSATLTGGRWTLVDDARAPLWEVLFAQVDLTQTHKEVTLAVRGARCRSRRPGLDTVIQADHLAWDNTTKRLTLAGVEVSSAQEMASFQVDQAHWSGIRQAFLTEGPVTFRRGCTWIKGRQLTADTALRSACLTQVTAQTQEGRTPLWKATAEGAEATEKRISLKQATGRLMATTPVVTFTAPEATWYTADQVLTLRGNLRAEQNGTVVTTSHLSWNRRAARWEGTHPLRWKRQGLEVEGQGLTAATDLCTAQIFAPRAKLWPGPITVEVLGRTAEWSSTNLLEPIRKVVGRESFPGPNRRKGSPPPPPKGGSDWLLVVHQVRASLRRAGLMVKVTASQAQWDPAAQVLYLSDGVRVREGERTARLAQATWSARTEKFVGRGGVEVQEGTARLSGEQWEADTGLQTFSLWPARLTFRDIARRQDWTARAERALRQADGTLALQQVVGTFRDTTGPIEWTADALLWNPSEPVVKAQGRVRLQAPVHDFRLQAEQLEWNRDTRRVTASGQVEGASELKAPWPTRWSGHFRRWVYDLTTKAVVEWK